MNKEIRKKVVIEWEELLEKVEKLSTFLINQEEVQTISNDAMSLLRQQLDYMVGYLGILSMRIDEE